jgi:hypothetical protein
MLGLEAAAPRLNAERTGQIDTPRLSDPIAAVNGAIGEEFVDTAIPKHSLERIKLPLEEAASDRRSTAVERHRHLVYEAKPRRWGGVGRGVQVMSMAVR